jgi:hypothetical protein
LSMIVPVGENIRCKREPKKLLWLSFQLLARLFLLLVQ